MGDGICDDETNTEACNWDGGDCCTEVVSAPDLGGACTAWSQCDSICCSSGAVGDTCTSTSGVCCNHDGKGESTGECGGGGGGKGQMPPDGDEVYKHPDKCFFRDPAAWAPRSDEFDVFHLDWMVNYCSDVGGFPYGDGLRQSTWTHTPQGCVDGENIKKYTDKTVDECKLLCLDDPTCMGIEYGVDYGGAGAYGPGDCQLSAPPPLRGATGRRTTSTSTRWTRVCVGRPAPSIVFGALPGPLALASAISDSRGSSPSHGAAMHEVAGRAVVIHDQNGAASLARSSAREGA